MRWAARVCLIAALLPTSLLYAQETGRITGTVTTETGQPLPGANVVVVGTNIGTLTGQDGRYLIPGVPAGTHQVQASLIGYASQTATVAVGAGQTVAADFRLSQRAIALEEIVAVGYGTQRRRDVTGSVASVQASQIRQIPTPSVGEALKGRAPGLDIRTSNFRPGDNPTIRVRGVRSLEASNDPLIVVDGVAIAGGLGDINPNTIESIEVLKDASATAVYGSRGANGVILITTRKGQPGSTRVTYDVRYGIEQIHKLIKPFTGPEYAQFKREAFRTAGKYNCGPGVIQCEEADRNLFSALELENIQNNTWTDYVDLIARNGSIQDHQLTITGGSENTRFAVGANFLKETGVTLAQGFVRRGGTFNLDHSGGRFTAGVSANITNQVQDNGPGNGMWSRAFQINPLGHYLDEEGNLIPTPIPDGQAWNPLLDAQNWKRSTQRTRAFGNAYASYEVLPGIVLRTTFGVDLTFRRDGEFRGACTQPNRCSSNNGWVEHAQTFNYVSTTQLNVDRQLTDNQRVNATVLYEIQREQFDRGRADVQNVPYEYQQWYNLGTAQTILGVSSDFREWLLQSVMGRVNYTLFDRYYLTFTARYDCSSRLAPGNKCSFFPSGAVKWRISDEGFMQGQGLFSDLSVRASYGVTGNTSINPYETQGSLSRTTYSFGGTAAFGYRPGELANPELGWEKTANFDLGLEFGLFNNRITGSVDGYIANTYDLLMERQLPTTTGFTNVLENIGETRNTGLELAISTINLDNWRGLTWRSDIVFATNKNEIVSLYGGKEDDVGNRWFIGKPINVNYEYEFAGIWQLGQEAEAAKYNQKVGDIRVVDQDQNGVIDARDLVVIGRHENFPAWTGSLSNYFQFGNFDLSGLIVARWGYMVRASMFPGALAGRYNQARINYWTPENPSNEYPRPNSDQESALYAGAVQLKDASHWRVRNITLGYQVPQSLTRPIGQNASVRLYTQAQDPFVFTDFEGFDPEGGGDIAVPSYRTFVFGASVTF